jgi:hypothetical protein
VVQYHQHQDDKFNPPVIEVGVNNYNYLTKRKNNIHKILHNTAVHKTNNIIL